MLAVSVSPGVGCFVNVMLASPLASATPVPMVLPCLSVTVIVSPAVAWMMLMLLPSSLIVPTMSGLTLPCPFSSGSGAATLTSTLPPTDWLNGAV